MKYEKLLLENIRKCRIGNGYSQDYIAFNLKISQQMYQKLESGQKSLNIDKIEKICDILKIDFTSLFYQSNNLDKIDSFNGKTEKQIELIALKLDLILLKVNSFSLD